MGKYCEIISRSLIDFEEIKMILANNNVMLVSGSQINDRVFLKNAPKVALDLKANLEY